MMPPVGAYGEETTFGATGAGVGTAEKDGASGCARREAAMGCLCPTIGAFLVARLTLC